MNRRIFFGLSILVVALFLIQPVASINVSNFDNQPAKVILETSPDVTDVVIDTEIEQQDASIDDTVITANKKPQQFYWDKTVENTQRAMRIDPKVPIIPYDMDKLVMKNDDPSMSPSEAQSGDLQMYDDYIPEMTRFGIPQSNSNSKSRADGANLKVEMIEWETKVNTGWGQFSESTSPGNQPGIGGFMVGQPTKITITVRNQDFPGKSVSGAMVNISIYDWLTFMPLIKIPQQLPLNIVTATTTVEYTFTPPAAKILYIVAYIDYPDDPDTTDNGLLWRGMRTLIWVADFESNGFGGGSGTDKTWTGDLGATDQWHTTGSAENQNNPGHTASQSYHHGTEAGFTDTYDDGQSPEGLIHLISPVIDMGEISSGQDEIGALPDGYFYPIATPMWAGLFTGELETGSPAYYWTTDVVWTCNYTDDGGNFWKSDLNPYSRNGYLFGDWESPFGMTTPDFWNPNWWLIAQNTVDIGWPLAIMTGDGAGGDVLDNGARNFSKIQFRVEFDGDEEDDETGFPGIYADDFITWGYQKWYPPYNLALTEVSSIVSSDGIPIISPGVETSFSVKLENNGETLTSIPVKVQISGPKGYSDTKQSTVGSLARGDQPATVNFKWTPPLGDGDYEIHVTVGDLTQDYTPDANQWKVLVYVRAPGGRVLIVDDDNSAQNAGDLTMRRFWAVNTETRMIGALDDLDISYNVFSTAFNKSGPTSAIMNNYEAVIWLTGLDNEYSVFFSNPNYGTNWGITLNSNDQQEIANFLNQGDKNFWLISPGTIYDLANTDEGTSDLSGFLVDYLQLIYVNANETTYQNNKVNKQGTPMYLEGETGSLAAGAKYRTYDAGSDEEPAMGDMGGYIRFDQSFSKPIFPQDLGKQNYNSLQYSKNYNLVYFAFNFYLINDAEHRKDLTYRVLNFFGMVGGVKVDLKDEIKKEIFFGETISFKYEIENLGLMAETMNIKLVTPAPDNVPKGWEVKINDKLPTATENTMTVGPGQSGKKAFYLNITAPSEYLDVTGNMDTTKYKNTSADSEIQFKVRVESANYPNNFYDFAASKVTMGLVGYVELSVKDDKTTGTIDISTEPEFTDEYFVEYTIFLRNVTNGFDPYDILVTIEKDNEIGAEILQGSTVVTDKEITLLPRVDQEVTIRVTADEHELMGDYTITFKAIDPTTEDVLNSTDLTTTVEQYFSIAITTVVGETYSRIADPNDMEADIQTEKFLFTIENYGNGPDTVELDWDENRDSPNAILAAWEDTLVEIFELKGGDTIEDIEVPAYDKLDGTPGTVDLEIYVNVPKEEEEGRYWVDIWITSSAPGSYIKNLAREDFETEVNASMMFEIIMPELKFDNDDSVILKSDGTKYIDQIDTIYEKDSVEVYIIVSNTGSAPANDIDIEFTATLDSVLVNSYSDTIDVAAGEDMNISWDFTTTDKGMYFFKVKIDPNNKLLGDSQQDNTWNQYLSVVQKKDDTPPPTGGDIFASDKEGGLSTTALALIVIIVIVIIVVVIVLFFYMQRKKGEEDEIDDITMVGGPMGMPGQMGGQPQPGMGMPPAGMGMPPGGMGAPPTMAQPSPDVKALSPQGRKQLPPAADTGTGCPNCGEKNPPENKFCQGCGGKL
jgi:hypothetical protein